MRRLQLFFIIMVLSTISLSITGFAGDSTDRTATVQVDGLSCPFCAYGLEKSLKKVDGIARVKMNMKSGKATVTFKPDVNIDDQVLRQAVEKAGFTARDITRP